MFELLDNINPSLGLKNQRLTIRSTSGKHQKNVLVARIPIENAMIRRSDFAPYETGLDRGALIAPAHAPASLQKTCRSERASRD